MPYGFRNRADRDSATAIARHARPPVYGSPAVPFEGRMWICEVPAGGMDGATGNVATKTKCDVKYLAENGLVSDMFELGNVGTNQTIDVYNPFEESFAADSLILVYQVGGRPTVMRNFADTAGAKLLSFYVTTPPNPAAGGIGDAVVVEPLTSGLSANDTITLYDTAGIWADLEPDANGLAISIDKIDDPANPGTPIDVWGIVYCERRIETYRVKLNAELYGSNQVVVDWNDKQNRFVLPYLQDYPEAAPEIENPLRVDCVDQGYIWIRRYWETANPYARKWYVHRSENWYARWLEVDITNVSGANFTFTVHRHADGDIPAGLTQVNLIGLADYLWPIVGDRILLQFDPNTGTYHWVNDTKYKARYVHGEITIPANKDPECTQYLLTLTPGCGGLSYWDGYNPGSAVFAWFDGFPFKCEENTQVEVTAVYRRETDDYKVISTQSALSGNVTGTRKVGVGNWSFECTSEGFCIKQEQVDIPVYGCSSSESSEPENQLCISSKDFLDCLDICDYICTYCDVFAVEECEPPPPPGECCEDCLFEELTGLTVSDGVFVDDALESATQTTNCCWSVTMTSGASGEVCYGGNGNWNVELSGGYSLNGTLQNGDCTGAGPGDIDGFTVTIAATGGPCADKCCPYSGDEFIEKFSAVNVDGIAVFQLPGAKAQLQGGGGGDCGAFATVPVRIEAEGQPGIGCNVVIDIRLRYDPDCNGGAGGCVWDVSIPKCDDVGFAADGFTAAEGCSGTMDVSNPCGNAGTPVRWSSGTFDVVDPDGPVACSDPVLPGVAASARPRVGSMLRQLHPELFGEGCNCGDVAKLLNGQTTDQAKRNVDRYAVALQNEALRTGLHSLSLDEIRLRIANAIHAETERIARQA